MSKGKNCERNPKRQQLYLNTSVMTASYKKLWKHISDYPTPAQSQSVTRADLWVMMLIPMDIDCAL